MKEGALQTLGKKGVQQDVVVKRLRRSNLTQNYFGKGWEQWKTMGYGLKNS